MGPHDDDNLMQPDAAQAPSAETVEHYLRLHEHIEQLRQDKRPNRPGRLTSDEARTYQAAALFRAATPGVDEPDPDFVASLRARMQQEVATPSTTRALRAARGQLSRRGLLAGGLGAAAAAAVGVAVGSTLPRAPEAPTAWQSPLVVEGKGTWLAVAGADEIPLGGVKRFVTETIVGFVRHTNTGFVALSGACTHMGCLLSWNGGARTFDCPCHGGRFTETGVAAAESTVAYRPLPGIATKVEQGQVWVYIVPSPEPSGTPTHDTTIYG